MELASNGDDNLFGPLIGSAKITKICSIRFFVVDATRGNGWLGI